MKKVLYITFSLFIINIFVIFGELSIIMDLINAKNTLANIIGLFAVLVAFVFNIYFNTFFFKFLKGTNE